MLTKNSDIFIANSFRYFVYSKATSLWIRFIIEPILSSLNDFSWPVAFGVIVIIVKQTQLFAGSPVGTVCEPF